MGMWTHSTLGMVTCTRCSFPVASFSGVSLNKVGTGYTLHEPLSIPRSVMAPPLKSRPSTFLPSDEVRR